MVEPRLSKEVLSRSRIIARGRRIRDLARLLGRYGGTPAGWVKKSSPELRDSRGRFEYHWYEHRGLGRFETKRLSKERR